jgi:hypothetical protein
MCIVVNVDVEQAYGGIKEPFPAFEILNVFKIEALQLSLATYQFNTLNDKALQPMLVQRGIGEAHWPGDGHICGGRIESVQESKFRWR